MRDLSNCREVTVSFRAAIAQADAHYETCERQLRAAGNQDECLSALEGMSLALRLMMLATTAWQNDTHTAGIGIS
jgi:hypothetical protein